jgi:hypothetical protein
MELHEALAQIADIRRQIVRTEKFRGYRAAPLASGGVLALAVAALQPLVIADPERELARYLTLWVAVAATAGGLMIADIWRRRRIEDHRRGMLTRLAGEQFAPCVVAGGLMTFAIAARVPQIAWLLPGLWALVFSLGVFASCRLLPKGAVAVGAWYLLWGCLLVALGPERGGLRPWTMAVAFGCGQLLTAVALSCDADPLEADDE